MAPYHAMTGWHDPITIYIRERGVGVTSEKKLWKKKIYIFHFYGLHCITFIKSQHFLFGTALRINCLKATFSKHKVVFGYCIIRHLGVCFLFRHMLWGLGCVLRESQCTDSSDGCCAIVLWCDKKLVRWKDEGGIYSWWFCSTTKNPQTAPPTPQCLAKSCLFSVSRPHSVMPKEFQVHGRFYLASFLLRSTLFCFAVTSEISEFRARMWSCNSQFSVPDAQFWLEADLIWSICLSITDIFIYFATIGTTCMQRRDLDSNLENRGRSMHRPTNSGRWLTHSDSWKQYKWINKY